ncbi:transcription factor Spi-C-like isoform X2 [Heptranchias perlo]|uniref:transcription factor Spi-C-like isoform X2 n=1 Tax=Heptranchias perlo TaxID=212740 RepID=UPI00355966B6
MNPDVEDLEVIMEFLDEQQHQFVFEQETGSVSGACAFGVPLEGWHPSSSTNRNPAFQEIFLPSQYYTFNPCGHSISADSVYSPGYSPLPDFNSTLPPDYMIRGFNCDKRKRKVRLFQFLFEMLQDPGMRHCIWWIQPSGGVFQFSSQNKEKLAEIWGRRKGNKKTMTYQKMARALRNYSRSGEITKVKRKLTYQFNQQILNRLWGGCRRPFNYSWVN